MSLKRSIRSLSPRFSNDSRAFLSPLQTEKRLYTSPTLLAGDLDTGKTMMFTGNVQPVAEKKFQVPVHT